MFNRAAIARPLGHCRVVGRNEEVNSSAPCVRSNDQSGKCAHGSTLSRETAAVRRAQKLASLFSGVLAIFLFISGDTHALFRPGLYPRVSSIFTKPKIVRR